MSDKFKVWEQMSRFDKTTIFAPHGMIHETQPDKIFVKIENVNSQEGPGSLKHILKLKIFFEGGSFLGLTKWLISFCSSYSQF